MTLGDSALGYEVQERSLPATRQGQGYWEYWNAEEIERGKCWDVLHGPSTEMEDYVEPQGLVSQLRQCLDFIEEQRGRPLSGAPGSTLRREPSGPCPTWWRPRP